LTKVTHPDLNTRQWNYNDITNELTATDETGKTFINKYNPIGLAIENGMLENGVYKSKSKFGYDLYNRLVWSEDAIGNRSTQSYDVWNRVISRALPNQSVSLTVYDDISRVVTNYDAENRNS
jgi:YD repeat-containing protein